jgi:hypothetical protein
VILITSLDLAKLHSASIKNNRDFISQQSGQSFALCSHSLSLGIIDITIDTHITAIPWGFSRLEVTVEYPKYIDREPLECSLARGYSGCGIVAYK